MIARFILEEGREKSFLHFFHSFLSSCVFFDARRQSYI
jgi:hypothetical protein